MKCFRCDTDCEPTPEQLADGCSSCPKCGRAVYFTPREYLEGLLAEACAPGPLLLRWYPSGRCSVEIVEEADSEVQIAECYIRGCFADALLAALGREPLKKED